MKESIYTIPISEVFEPKCGCPICALYSQLETRWVEYITGAAMMEPDVRVETNKQGFCLKHFEMMLSQRNRLSVALVLQTRLAHVDETLIPVFEKRSLFTKAAAPSTEKSCFVCSQINREFLRIGDNIASLWGRDSDFKELYSEQEFLCLPHYRSLIAAAPKALKQAEVESFISESARLTRKRLSQVKADIDSFCNLFDYRNAGSGAPSPEVSAAIEFAIEYLISEAPGAAEKQGK